MKGAIAGLPGWLTSLGGMMMAGLLAAINPMALATRLLAVARNGVAAFKNFFGIKSPSRLMMQMGGHMTTGLALGLDRGGGGPLNSMSRLAAGVAGAGALALSGPAIATQRGGLADRGAGAMALAGSTIVAPRPGDANSVGAGPLEPIRRLVAGIVGASERALSGPAIASPRVGMAGGGGDTHVSITIHQQPGEDARDLARRVADEIDRRKRSARNSGYEDDF